MEANGFLTPVSTPVFTSARAFNATAGYNRLTILLLPVTIAGCAVWAGKAILAECGHWLAGFEGF